MARFGALVPIRMGLVAFPIGLGLTADALGNHRPQLLLELGLALCGLAVSWSLPALVGFAVQHATPDTAGVVGGLLNASRQVGATAAAAVASATLTRSGHHAVPFLIAAAISVLGFGMSTRILRIDRSSRGER